MDLCGSFQSWSERQAICHWLNRRGNHWEEESKTGEEMELLKLYDCCVPNFRLRPSVARRGGCYVPGAKQIDEKRGSLEGSDALSLDLGLQDNTI